MTRLITMMGTRFLRHTGSPRRGSGSRGPRFSAEGLRNIASARRSNHFRTVRCVADPRWASTSEQSIDVEGLALRYFAQF
jgi:hypothetical protein